MKKKNRQKKKKQEIFSQPGSAVKEKIKSSNGFGAPLFKKNHLIYERNMQALKSRHPDLARQLQNTVVQDCEVIAGKGGVLPNLLIKSRGLTYYRDDDPLGGVKKQLEDLKLKNTRLAVFLGFGLGYELIHYVKHMAVEQNTSFFLVVEKDLEIFKAALGTIDLSQLLGSNHIHFMVGMKEEQLYVELRNYLAENSRFKYLKAIKPVYCHSALQLHKDYYLNALKHLRESGTHQVLNYGNCPEDSLIGVRNMMENIEEIVFNPGVNLLLNKFKGKPAVVVSTGPSLNKNKHLLKGLEDKALLVAADASLKVMLEMGVKPHLVTSLERTIIVKKLMEGFTPEEVEDVYYASCPVIDQEVYRAYPGPRVIVYRNFDHFKWLNIERGILHIQLSAGNMAFKVAEALGCDPIILIGQDLSYGEGGTTHALGTANTKDGIVNNQRKQRMIEVPGNNGKPVLTNEAWYPCIKAYDLDLAGYNGTCINSTEGGAVLSGALIMPFRESIDKYISEPFHPLERIKEYLSVFTTEDAAHDYRAVSDLVEKTISDMEAIAANCRQGLELIKSNRVTLINYLQKINDHQPDIAELEREILAPKTDCITGYHHTFQLYFMHIIQSFNIKFEMDMISIPEKHDCANRSKAEVILRHAEWYSVIGNLARVSVDILYKSRDRLKLAEEKSADGVLQCR